MTNKEQVRELTKWPTNREGMTVDLMLRIIGHDTQLTWLRKEPPVPHSDLYMSQTIQIISSVALMGCIRALRDVNPAAADAFVKEHWEMCEGGDAFGEWLWEWTEKAGLDPSLVELPVAVAAVDPVGGRITG